MKYEIQLSDEAEEDLLESFVWYERKQPGLGDEFLAEIQNSFQLICKRPESYRIRYTQKVRAFVVDRFPFLILYIIREEMVDVISIFHTSRNPKTWKKRV